jgi:hypothetical protein
MLAERQAKQRAARWKRKRSVHIPGYTPESETAEELNVSVRTLRKWRQLRIGPPYIEVGRQIHYGDESRAAWLKSREVRPVRELLSA